MSVSLITRPSHSPVFDLLQYQKLDCGGGGGGTRLSVSDTMLLPPCPTQCGCTAADSTVVGLL